MKMQRRLALLVLSALQAGALHAQAPAAERMRCGWASFDTVTNDIDDAIGS